MSGDATAITRSLNVHTMFTRTDILSSKKFLLASRFIIHGALKLYDFIGITAYLLNISLVADLAIDTNDNPAVSSVCMIICVCVCACAVCSRSELSVEKTSVLQSELQSCTQLLELEPQNKCESSMSLIIIHLHFFPPLVCFAHMLLFFFFWSYTICLPQGAC